MRLLPALSRALLALLLALGDACGDDPAATLIVTVSADLALAAQLTRVEALRVAENGQVLRRTVIDPHAFDCSRRDGRGQLLYSLEVAKSTGELARVLVTAYGAGADGAEIVLAEQLATARIDRENYRLIELFLSGSCASTAPACDAHRCDLAAIECSAALETHELPILRANWGSDELCGESLDATVGEDAGVSEVESGLGPGPGEDPPDTGTGEPPSVDEGDGGAPCPADAACGQCEQADACAEPDPCTSGDAQCSAGCMWPTDTDCPKPDGEPCAAAGECLHGHCEQQVCCDTACAGPCFACDQNGSVGQCTELAQPASLDHCGGCGRACNVDHVDEPYCEAGECKGICAPGWGNCDSDLREDGCETNLNIDDAHCGACQPSAERPSVQCDYAGSCVLGECIRYTFGHWWSSTSVQRWPANRFAGLSGPIDAPDTTLVALGIKVALGLPLYPPANVRMGVYTDFGGLPGTLIAETEPFRTDALAQGDPRVLQGPFGLEVRVRQPVALQAGQFYWIMFVADSDLYFYVDSQEDRWIYGGNNVNYAGLTGMPTALGPLGLTESYDPAGVLYAVAVPQR